MKIEDLTNLCNQVMHGLPEVSHKLELSHHILLGPLEEVLVVVAVGEHSMVEVELDDFLQGPLPFRDVEIWHNVEQNPFWHHKVGHIDQLLDWQLHYGHPLPVVESHVQELEVRPG